MLASFYSRASVLSALSALACLIASCGGSEPTGVAPSTGVASIAVDPPAARLPIGYHLTVAATVHDNAGQLVPGASLAWKSSDATVATVTPGGEIVAMSAGRASVDASADGHHATVDVTVFVMPVATVQISPDTFVIAVGATAQLSVAAAGADGIILTGRAVTWGSSNAGIVSVTSSGLVTASAVGTARLTATVEGRIAEAVATVVSQPVASVSVSPASRTLFTGATVQLTATTSDAGGAALPGRAVAWSSSNAAVATVSARGLVTARTPGVATITATSEGKVATASITAQLAPVSSVTISPAAVSLTIGQTSALSVMLRDASGTALTGRALVFTPRNTAIATVSASGVVTGVAAGTTRVVATSEGVSDSVTTTVTAPAPVPVATVTVSPPSSTVTIGQTTTLTAVTKDAGGGILGGRAVTWASATPGVATVSPSGVVTAVATGAATITASSEGKSGTATITVPAAGGGGGGDTHAGFYVAPTGAGSGDGSSGRPWDLATALAHPSRVQPGDTIWLRGGTYRGTFASRLSGTSSAPIIVRQYPGERATVAGTMSIDGSYTWYWGFEVVNVNAGTQDIMGLNVHGPGTRFINLVVHEHSGNGLGVWAEAPDAEVYGSLVYNNGFHGSTATSHGHGIYSQNRSGTKRIVDNIIFNQYGYGLHTYAEGVPLHSFRILGNLAFNNANGDILVGGYTTPVDDIVVSDNSTYRTDNGTGARLGFQSSPRLGDVTLTNNYIIGATQIQNWNNATLTGNTFLKADQLMQLSLASGQSASGYRWSGNSYLKAPGTPSSAFAAFVGGSWSYYDLAGWQSALGLDGSSNFGVGSPSGQRVVVRPNQYEVGRANIMIYNWSRQGSATVDLSRVLTAGQRYEVRNAQDFFGAPVATGTYGGGSVTVPLIPVTPPAPLGGGSPPSTSDEVFAFVVLIPGS